MLILDKSRALDLMVSQSARVDVPEEFAFGWPSESTGAPVRSGFRVAIYGPLEAAPATSTPREWTSSWGSRVPLPMAG